MTFRTFGSLCAALLLAGCDMADFKLPNFAGVTQSASMFLGRASVQAPENFCVDRSVSQLANGFAVLAPCVIYNEDVDFPAHPALITVQMDQQGTAAIAGTEDFLRDLLRRQPETLLQDPKPTSVLETDIGERAVAVHYRIEADDRTDGLTQDVWRVFADVQGRLVTLSLRGYSESPLTVDDGRTLLYETLDLLREANA